MQDAPAYSRPKTLDVALAARAAGARVAAGCTDLFPATTRQIIPGPVVDITRVSGLRGITRQHGAWRIGAATTWTDILRADLPPEFDALRQAAREVGSIQIQNAGTIGGNLCNASPAADGVPPLLTLNADVEVTSPQGARTLPLASFITGVRETALGPDEIATAVLVPDCAGQSVFLKLGARAYLVISIAMVAVRLEVDEVGVINDAALSVGSCSAVAARLPMAEAALRGLPLRDAAERVRADMVEPALSPITDIRADDTYRMGAATELVRRAIRRLASLSGSSA